MIWLIATGVGVLLLCGAGVAWLVFNKKKDYVWHYQQAIAAYKANQYTLARQQLVACLKMNNTFSNGWYTLGLIAQNENRLESATKYYERALELTPDDNYTLFNQGQVFIAQEEFESAKIVIEHLLGLDDEDPDAVFALCLCQEKLDDGEHASENLKKVLALNPEHAEANFKMGQQCIDEGEYTDAITHFKTTLATDENYTPAYIELASTLAKQELWDECITICQQGSLKEPSNPRFYNQIGLAYYYKENLAEAIRNYETAIQLDPTYYLAYNNLGFANEKDGNLSEAIEAFKYYMQYVRGTPAARETLDHIRELETQLPATAKAAAATPAPESAPTPPEEAPTPNTSTVEDEEAASPASNTADAPATAPPEAPEGPQEAQPLPESPSQGDAPTSGTPATPNTTHNDDNGEGDPVPTASLSDKSAAPSTPAP